MSEPISPATAENPAADGDSPPAETQPQTDGTQAAAPQTDAAHAGESLDDIRAQLRANSGALATPRVATDNWNVLDENQPTEEEQALADADATAAEAQAKADSDAAAAEQAAADAQAKADAEAARKKDPSRVRIGRFAEDDRKVIARMAEKEGLTIDQARAELIAEGVLAKPEATAAAAAPAAKAGEESAAGTITAKQTEIADIEKQIEDAATAFDTPKLAKLQIQHNRALADLGKLEAQAERDSQQSQSAELTRMETEVAASQEAAIGMFPDSGVKGSPLYEAIEDLIDAAPPAAFADPDWPVTFAAKAARQIHYRPPAPAAATPRETPAVLPKKPARPVPPSPASGATPGAAGTKQPTAAEQLEAAGDDPDKIKAVLRRVGTAFGS